MDTIRKISFNSVGQRTQNPYQGSFSIETVLSRRDNFAADERRRVIIGANPAGVAPSIMGEAYMLSQLFVRIVEAPKWWTESDNGMDLKDENVIGELFRLVELKVKEYEDEIIDAGKEAVSKLNKSAKKITVQEEGADAKE
jgi:hypothetical protein